MRRTASSTICFQERSSRLGTGKDMMATSMKLLAACQIEREYEIVDGVGGADLVTHVDEDPLLRVGVGHGLDLDVADAELVLGERFFDVVRHQGLRRGVVGREDEVVDAAAPFGAHLPLAEGGANDDAHRLLDVGLVLAELDAAVRADSEGELETYSEEVAHQCRPSRYLFAAMRSRSPLRQPSCNSGSSRSCGPAPLALAARRVRCTPGR